MTPMVAETFIDATSNSEARMRSGSDPLALAMRPLTEEESKLVFTKLANYIVRAPFNY